MTGLQEPDLLPGKLLGRYQVLGAIGAGGSGSVYRALDPEEGTEVAIKHVRGAGDSGRLEIEARLLASLDHPRVVRLRDHFSSADGAYNLVMDLVPGRSLGRTLWEHGSPGLSPSDALAWGRDACEALAYVHEQGIVHGDVKPLNLVEARDGVVLIDFGIATGAAQDGTAALAAGTAGFMAPEVFAGETATLRSDLYSLGATLWNLLTGTPPAYGEDRPLPAACDGAGAALRAALEIEPARRIGSAAELAAALGAPLGAARGASLAVSVDDAAAPRRLLEAVVRTAAGVFDAAAASIALVRPDGGLRYVASWGAGAAEIVGVELEPGVGIAGAVAARGEGEAIARCRIDPRFAAAVASGVGYVPHTMLVVPLRSRGRVVGVLSVLDRRDAEPFGPADLPRGALFADLAVTALD